MRLELLNLFVPDKYKTPWTTATINRHERYLTMDPVNHYNNAPFIQVDNYDLKTKLRLNIHEWCASCNISYSLGYERIRGTIGENCIWYIEIPDPVMAVLFKLTWM